MQAYDKGLGLVQDKFRQDNPAHVSLQMDGWTAHHTGYMGAIIGKTIHILIVSQEKTLLLLYTLCLKVRNTSSS